MTLVLRPYQSAGIDFLRDKGRALLADEPGLGKTQQLLRASEGRTLILAPAMIHNGKTWETEIEKAGLDPDRFTMAAYTSLCDRESYIQDGCACKTDRRPHNEWQAPQLYSGKCKRMAHRVVERPRPEFKGPWDTIIADEAHYLKGRGTSWTKVLRQMSRRAGRIYLATGTPISNYAQELFTSLQLLYPERAKGGGDLGSYWRWIEQWFFTSKSHFSEHTPLIGDLLACHVAKTCAGRPATDPCEHYREFFQANLGDRYMQRLRSDVLTDLPPLTEQTVECPMTPKQARQYKSMKKECLAENQDGEMVVAWSKSAAHLRCDQIATGLGILTGTGEESGKLERLRFDLEERFTPTLVVAHYRASVEAAAAVARSLGKTVAVIHGGVGEKERGEAVQRFQRGEIQVLVGSLETISEGLTLTAADLVIFLEKSWKPSRNEQALRRIHRLGQDRPCLALDYVTPDTVDVGKRELLQSKTDQQMRTLKWGVVRALL